MRPDIAVVIVAAVLVLSSPFVEQSALQVSAAALLAMNGWLLLKPAIPPIIPFVLAYQWAQVSCAALYANYLGIRLDQLYVLGDPVRATWLGMGALFCATTICALFRKRISHAFGNGLVDSLSRFSIPTAARIYAALVVVVLLLWPLIGVSSQFFQVYLGIVTLRWAAFFLLLASSLVQRRAYWLAMWAFVFEMVFGFSGYFAGFAIPLFFTLFAFSATFHVLSRRLKSLAYGMFAVALSMGMVWNVVKNDYRHFVSGYSGEQIVTVGLADRYSRLGNLVNESLSADKDSFLDSFAMRLAYIEYFGIVLDRVPMELPHRNGELMLIALQHVLVPRVIYPDKAPLAPDSELTAYYTGNVQILQMTGTSISLGFVTESYIDFGTPGPYFAGLIMGLILVGGAIALQRISPDPAIAVAITCSSLLSLRLFETSLPKMLGGVLAAILVQWFIVFALNRWMMPRLIGSFPSSKN